MIIAAAQTTPRRGDITFNLEDHCIRIEKAADHGAGLIVFPEMSITGYERDRAAQLAFHPDDARLSDLRKLSKQHSITVVAGAPIRINSDLHIGSFVLLPDGSTTFYLKQFLHSGEELFFEPSSDHKPLVEISGYRTSLAICADIEHQKHIENAREAQSELYAASIFYTPTGMSGAFQKLSGYARDYSLNILMSNYVGSSWELPAGGQSAFWNNKGQRIAQLNSEEEGLLIIGQNDGKWSGTAVYD